MKKRGECGRPRSKESSSSGVESDAVIIYMDSNGTPCFHISDDTLNGMSVRQLNWSLRQQPSEVVQQVKERRRLLKNRGYAQNTRLKTNELSEDLQMNKQQLSDDIRTLKRTNKALEQQLEQLTAKRRRLQVQLQAKA